MLWAIDEARTDWIVVDYSYFETEHPLVDEDSGTYVETDVEFRNNLTHSLEPRVRRDHHRVG